MPVEDRTHSYPQGRTVLQTDEARQGVTGHNVRYVLGFGLLGAVAVAFLVIYLFGFFH